MSLAENFLELATRARRWLCRELPEATLGLGPRTAVGQLSSEGRSALKCLSLPPPGGQPWGPLRPVEERRDLGQRVGR